MTFSDLFPSDYLTIDDFPAPRIFTIAGVSIQELRRPGGKKDKKPVMHFKDEGAKPFVLNKTNGLVIAKMYGRKPLEWAGKPIELFADYSVKYGIEIVGGIRVRVPAKPKQNNNGQTPLSTEQKHEMILHAFRQATTTANLDEWATWAGKQTFDEHQQEAQAAGYAAAEDRLAPVRAPLPPVDNPQLVSTTVASDIPF